MQNVNKRWTMVVNYSTQLPQWLKNVDREDIRIYTGAFRTLPVEPLHAEAYVYPYNQERMNWDWDSFINWDLHLGRVREDLDKIKREINEEEIEWQRGPKLYRKCRNNQINRSKSKKMETRIYELAERGGRELLGTTAAMVTK